MKRIKYLAAASIFLAAIISGCSKNDQPEPASDFSAVQDHATAEIAFHDAGQMADEGARTGSESGRMAKDDGILGGCATRSLDLISVPHRLVIDFGTTDCLGRDGNYRRGKIIVTWSGRYREEGSEYAITFDNYYYNFNKVEGEKRVRNNGRNDAGNLVFLITVRGRVIIGETPNSSTAAGTISYSSDRSMEWTAGESTFRWGDDVYMVSGTASGTTIKGLNYTMSTTSSLKKEIGYPFFTSGIVVISSGDHVRTVDYGYPDGGRDDLALVTENGNSVVIHLNRRG